jgi:hypothetical protein
MKAPLLQRYDVVAWSPFCPLYHLSFNSVQSSSYTFNIWASVTNDLLPCEIVRSSRPILAKILDTREITGRQNWISLDSLEILLLGEKNELGKE